MITLNEWLQEINFKVTSGGKYGWQCYGDNAWMLDFCEEIDNRYRIEANIILDTVTGRVYSVETTDYDSDRSYRLIDPTYQTAYKNECKDRGVKDEVYEGHKYIDLETDEDFLGKLRAIVNGTEYDERVVIPLDIDSDILHNLMLAAHQRDVTLNQFINDALEESFNNDSLETE